MKAPDEQVAAATEQRKEENADYKELVTGHGFSQNQLCLWKYPSMTKVAELTGHTSRVLHMAQSPDGTTIVLFPEGNRLQTSPDGTRIVSASRDKTLRIWEE